LSEGPLHVTRNGPILEVVLDRPKANAIDAPTSRIMGEAFVKFRDDPELRVAIITGAGERFFCAGWDLKAAAAGESPDVNNGVGGFGGMAVGGGFEWALSADMILAAEHARFALPEIKAGTLADAATIRLPRRIPYHVAMDLLLTGRWMEAEEALRRGLVNEILPAGQLLPRARELAALLAGGPPLVFAAIKEVVRESQTLSFEEALRGTRERRFRTVEILYGSEDQKEGARAFAEKREPIWKGR